MPTSDEEIANLLLETLPVLMGDLRDRLAASAEEGRPRPSFTQLRALNFIGRNDGASLTDVASAMKLTMPAASKLVQSLVETGFVERTTSATDRRQSELRIGPAAKARWDRARREGRVLVAERLGGLTPQEREQVAAALHALRRVLHASR